MNETTWYAAYESTDASGYDADYVPCESREAAQVEAGRYLEFATGDEDAVYIVEVPNAICAAGDEEWSLWDCLIDLEPIYLYNGSNRNAEGIVDGLRSLADGENDQLGVLMRRAADEIVRLRRVVETKR